MERRLKERLIGAAVLVLLAVIFIPMILDDSSQTESAITRTNIPAKPDDAYFTSRIVPLEEATKNVIAVEAEAAEVITAGQTTPEKELAQQKQIQQAPAVEQVAEPDTQQFLSKPATLRKTDGVGLTAWVVQLGSFSSEANANALNKKLRKAGYTAFVEPLKQKSGVIYRVRVGPELLRSNALALQKKLKKTTNMDGIVVHYP